MARLDDIDLDIKNAVLRANATDREEIARILNYLYRLSGKLKWWQTKLDRGNLMEEERKVYEGLITGEEEIRQELAGKVDKDYLAGPMQNGLLSMLDWPKLQYNMIPKYSNMDYYSFNMGFHYASSAVAVTLTNYPTSRDSVLMCIGEPDIQYQIVIEADRSSPKIYGRPVYNYEPWSAWKELHWFDTATASSDGLMSAADKARLDGLDDNGKITPISIANNTDLNDLKQDGFYVCGQDSIAATLGNCPTVNAFWMEVHRTVSTSGYPISGCEQGLTTYMTGNTSRKYVRRYYNGTWGSWTSIDFNDRYVSFVDIRNTTNTSNGTGMARRLGKTVLLNFTATMSVAMSAGTWYIVGTLPSGYRPPEDIMNFVLCTTSANPEYLRGYITASSGNIAVKSATALATGKQLVGSTTFFV